MPVDYDTLLYGPIYAAFGVTATLDLGTAGTFPLTVTDETAGVMLDTGNGLSLATMKPAASVRVSELTALGLTREQLKGGTISFNEGSWEIKATQPKRNPAGAGELYLILEEV